MLFKLSNLNSNLVLTLGYLNPALNNSAQGLNIFGRGFGRAYKQTEGFISEGGEGRGVNPYNRIGKALQNKL